MRETERRGGRGEERQRKSVAAETIVVPGVICDLATGTWQTWKIKHHYYFIYHSYDNFIQSLNILSPV